MKALKSILPRAVALLLVFTILCGVLYTALVTAAARLFFPSQADGGIFTADGKSYSLMLGQPFSDEKHLWGRVTGLDVSTFAAEDNTPLLYAAPSNLSPASETYGEQIRQRVERLRQAHPERADQPVPVDLVTGSGSGLDPHISPAAAEYQVPRLARANGISEQEVREIISQCTSGRLLGLLGEKTVNVLEVNLMLDGLL